MNRFTFVSTLRRVFPNRSLGELITSWLVSPRGLEKMCVKLNLKHIGLILGSEGIFEGSHSFIPRSPIPVIQED